MWLKITPSGMSEARLVWGNELGPYDDYHIGLGTLTKTCEQVRKDLAVVVRTSNNESPVAKARALRALARSGDDLYFVLFNAKETNADTATIKAAMAEKYAGGDTQLRITGHPALHIPWGLAFDGESGAIPNDAEGIEFYGGFWGLKYMLSSTLTGYTQPLTKLSRHWEKSVLLGMLNRHVMPLTYNRLSEEERQAYMALAGRPIHVAHDVAGCERLMNDGLSHDVLLLFFGHQEAGVLDLGDDERINVVKFQRLLEKLVASNDPSSYSLVMLNACDSATGHMDYSFIHVADRPGMCGSIGTESIIPQDFAARFATLFVLRLVYEGMSVGETMSELKRTKGLWPLSLAYSCYAQPDYRISIKPGARQEVVFNLLDRLRTGAHHG